MVEKAFASDVSHDFIFIMIGIIGGILAGLSSLLFITLLNYAQNLRETQPRLIFLLPIIGVIIALLRGAPKLILGSFLTHLAGGSAGREGAIIHLCRILSEIVSKLLNLQDRKLRRLVIVSMGAGFGAALGAPLAGFIFGFEFNKSKFFQPWTLLHCLIAGLMAQLIVKFTHVVHFRLPALDVPDFEIKNFTIVLIAGILFGLITSAFHYWRHRCEFTFQKASPIFTGFLGGLILSVLYFMFGLQEFQGLGFQTITQATKEILPLTVSIKKAILSAITLGTGFQGGEFAPLAFIGSTLGSSFSFVSPSLTALMASLGFVSTYGASTQTPIACSILAAELFGWKTLPFAVLSILIANQVHSRISKPSKD